MRSVQRLSFVVTLIAAGSGCGGEAADAPRPDAGAPAAALDGGERVDAGISTAPSSAGLFFVPSEAEDRVTVVAMASDGATEAWATTLTTPRAPRAVALHPDALEGAVVYAGRGPGTPKGIVWFDWDPSMRRIMPRTALALGDQLAPTAVRYLDGDTVVVAARGPGDDQLHFLHRQGDGWTWTRSVPAGEGPRQLAYVPEPETLLVFRTALDGPYSHVGTFRPTASEGEWTRVGEAALWGQPLEMALHPDQRRVFSPSLDRETRLALNPRGLLHEVAATTSTGAWTERLPEHPLPAQAHQIAIRPDGAQVIVADQVLALGSDGVPFLDHYELFRLAAEGDTFTAEASSVPVAARRIFDLQFLTRERLWMVLRPSVDQAPHLVIGELEGDKLAPRSSLILDEDPGHVALWTPPDDPR